MGSLIKIELPTDWYNDDFLGFALCSILEHLPERIICRLNSDVFYYGDLKDFGHDFHWKGDIIRSEHVWLGYQPCSQLRLFQFNDPNYWNYIEISFEVAHRFNSSASNVVKKCGVWTLVLVVAVRGPLTVPRSSSSANTLKNGYHHPGAFFQ